MSTNIKLWSLIILDKVDVPTLKSGETLNSFLRKCWPKLYSRYVAGLFGMLFVVMPLAVIRPRKSLTAAWRVTGERALAMNSIYVTTEIFAQCKSLSMRAASNVTLERTIMAFGVLTSKRESVRSLNYWARWKCILEITAAREYFVACGALKLPVVPSSANRSFLLYYYLIDRRGLKLRSLVTREAVSFRAVSIELIL